MISEQIEILQESLDRMNYLRPIVEDQFLADFKRKKRKIEAELQQLTIDYLSDKFGLNLGE